MGRIRQSQTKASLEAQVAELLLSLAEARDRNRSLAVLLQRAERDRDHALGRLSTCAAENGALRRDLLALRAAAELARTGG